MRFWPFSGRNKRGSKMDDGDGYSNLDNLEYALDFGDPTDHSAGEAVGVIQGVSLDRDRLINWRISRLSLIMSMLQLPSLRYKGHWSLLVGHTLSLLYRAHYLACR